MKTMSPWTTLSAVHLHLISASKKMMFKACQVFVILNKGIVLSNVNNGNVMASHSDSGYHTYLRRQDREKGKWNNRVLFVCFSCCFWKVLSVVGAKGGWTPAAENLRLISRSKKTIIWIMFACNKMKYKYRHIVHNLE